MGLKAFFQMNLQSNENYPRKRDLTGNNKAKKLN